MRFVVDCFVAIWNCVPGNPGDPKPAPEINAASGAAALAFLLCVGVILYRQMQQEQH